MQKIIFIFLLFSKLFSEPFVGLTLITNSINPNENDDSQLAYTHLVDNNQNIINAWVHTTSPASIAYLSKDSILYTPCKISNDITGPEGGRFTKMDWFGNIIWDYTLPQSICRPHHDIEVLPNGNILAICTETKTQNEAVNVGIQNINGDMSLDMIIEIQPIGSNEADIVWEWHFWDHLVQDINPSLDNYGIINENPQLLNINCEGSPGSGGGNVGIRDWNHCNSISYNTILDQIVISSRHMNEFYVIDHSTSIIEASSHSGGNSGLGGDFLYRWGNPQNYNRGNSENQILSAQHGVNWIQEGFPGAGNFIIFNNKHENNSSAVLEIVPPIQSNGLYEISGSEPFAPESYFWIYQSNFYSGFQSGAFRLENGNTLITSTNDSSVFEVNMDGEVEWSYEGDLKTARAIKYPLDYLSVSIPGDLNSDGIINILDVIQLINIVLSNTFQAGGDINNDEVINILDVVLLVNLILN